MAKRIRPQPRHPETGRFVPAWECSQAELVNLAIDRAIGWIDPPDRHERIEAAGRHVVSVAERVYGGDYDVAEEAIDALREAVKHA